MSFNSSLLADLTALFNDNTSGDISAADGRTVIEALLELANPLDHKPGSADTPDDDFNGGTLDAKWTAVTGTAGSVSLLSTGNISTYDIATRPGYLLTQVGDNGSQEVSLRQTFTLPDAASIIVKVAVGSYSSGDGTSTTDSQAIALVLNDSDTAFTAGNSIQLGFLNGAGVGRIFTYDGTTVFATGGTGANSGIGVESGILLRLARSTLTYFPMFSLNGGQSWHTLGTGYVKGAALTRLWIVHDNGAAATMVVPVAAWDWVRQGTNNFDPW